MKEELARKTCDIQRMAAEIHELRSNLEEHFQIEHSPLEPLRYNRNPIHPRFQVNSIHEKHSSNNEHHKEQSKDDKNWKNTNAIKNTQYWTYDTNDDNPHPILRPLVDHQYNDDLIMQMQQPYQESISNGQHINDSSGLEGGESSSIEPLEESNDEHYNIPLQIYQQRASHEFSYVVPCHYVEGLLKNYPKKDKELQLENDQATMYLYIAPKKIVIEKKIIVETDFEEKISMSRPNSYKQNIKVNKTNWSLNYPILDNEIFYNDQYPSHMIAESSQIDNNDQLSIKLEIFDQMPKFDNVPNNTNKIQERLSYNDSPIKHESIVQQNKTSNMDDPTRDPTHSKVYFHHTTQDEKKKKVYYKTPKHSYSQSKINANGYDDDGDEFDYEISNDASKKRSYIVNNFNKNDNFGSNSRWSSPSQLALRDNTFESQNELLYLDQKDEEININSNECVYIHNEDAPNDIIENQSHNIESRVSHKHWDPNSSLKQVETPTTLIVPNVESFNKENNTYESNIKNESNNNHSSTNHPIHSILHHSGKQHPHHEHIIWGDNFVSDEQQELQNINHSIMEVKPSHISQVQESLQPSALIDKEFLSIEKIKIDDNKVQGQSQEINEAPSLLDRNFVISFQSSPDEQSFENTSQNVVEEESIEKSTNASLEIQSTKEKVYENSHELVIDSTKETIHQNKNAKFSKSPSFVQSFLSLFQGSSHNAQEEKSHENENAIQNNESTSQKDSINQVSTQLEGDTRNSKKVDKSDDVSTILSSFHEPTSFQSSIPQDHIKGRHESIALNELSNENEIQDKDVLNSNYENKSIDDEAYYNELPHRKMDASRKASVDEVRKELLLKLRNQQEEELEDTTTLNNVKMNTLDHESIHAIRNDELVNENFDKVLQNKKEEFSHVSLQHTNHEPRRYSIDKIDVNKLKDMQYRSQSTSMSRTSLYSSFRDRPSKSIVNSQFFRTNEFTSNIHEGHESFGVENEVRESKDKENVQESQAKIYYQGSIIHSKQTSFDMNANEEDTSFDKNDNGSITNAFNDKVVETFMPSNSLISTFNNENQRSNRSSKVSTNDDNDPDKSILCVARIRFVFPGKSTILATSQNHTTTSTSSTPNKSDFNVGLKFNNEKSQSYN